MKHTLLLISHFCWLGYQPTEGVCSFIAFCVTKIKTVFRGPIFRWFFSLTVNSTKYPQNISMEEGKDQESNITPDPGHHMDKWKNTRKRHIQESKEVSPFPAGDHKDARNRQDSMTDKHKPQTTQDLQKKHRLGTVSKKITEGLKHI